MKAITGFIKLCPQYKCYYKGEVQYSYTMDFSFVCQSSDIKAIGNPVLTLFSIACLNSSIANEFFMFKLSFSGFFFFFYRTTLDPEQLFYGHIVAL